MSSNFIYYVYAYLRIDGTPYYIGKGCRGRAYDKSAHNIKPPPPNRIVFLETKLSNVGALALERRYIRWYGRKDNNTGILRNMTDGGEGRSGSIISDVTRKKLSQRRIGRPCSELTKQKIANSLKGRKRPPEVIEKMREASTGKIQSKETISKRVEKLKGKPCSEEKRRKISESLRKNWQARIQKE